MSTVKKSHAASSSLAHDRTPATTDLYAVERDQGLPVARCSTPSPAPPDSPARRARREYGGDPSSGSPEQAGSRAPGPVQRYAGDRPLESPSWDRSNAERPTAGATEAGSPQSRSSPAQDHAAASASAPQARTGPSTPTEAESPADAAPSPRAAEPAVQHPSPTRHGRGSRPKQAARGRPHTKLRTTSDRSCRTRQTRPG